MKTFITTLFSLASLVPATTANFDIYYNRARGVSGSAATGWVLFNAPPHCEQLVNVHVWSSEDDVSGSKRGIRCEGDGCGPEGEIALMEMNFGDDTHWTVYKDRNYDLINLDGNVQGSCFMYPNDDHKCDVGPIGYIEGFRRIRCLNNSWDADDLNP